MSSTGANQTNLSNDLSFKDTSPDWESVAYTPVTVDNFFYNPATDKPEARRHHALGVLLGAHRHGRHDDGLFNSGTKEAGQFFIVNFVRAPDSTPTSA